MGVAEAQSRISSREFSEWQAFYGLEPFGEARADLRSAQIAHAAWNAMRSGKDHVPPDAFLLRFDREEMTEEQITAQNKAAMAAIFGKHRNTIGNFGGK
jgi:hypothetical protein